MTSDVYDEAKIMRVLEVIIAETKRCLKRFCAEKEYPEVVGNVLMQQFNRFVENCKQKKEAGENRFREYLFAEICETLALELENLGLKAAPSEVREQERLLAR